MTDVSGEIRNPLDPDVDYDLYDYWLPVNYGWVTEPTESTDD
jgi:hypothetical protein